MYRFKIIYNDIYIYIYIQKAKNNFSSRKQKNSMYDARNAYWQKRKKNKRNVTIAAMMITVDYSAPIITDSYVKSNEQKCFTNIAVTHNISHYELNFYSLYIECESLYNTYFCFIEYLSLTYFFTGDDNGECIYPLLAYWNHGRPRCIRLGCSSFISHLWQSTKHIKWSNKVVHKNNIIRAYNHNTYITRNYGASQVSCTHVLVVWISSNQFHASHLGQCISSWDCKNSQH